MLLSWMLSSELSGQEFKIRASALDGVIIAGYVDGGGFTNFTGPNIQLSKGQTKYILGALPSLRYKNDRNTPKNSFVTPSLGVGLTFCYKIWAVQIPLYYNSKTATENGSWHVGVGIGLRLNEWNKSE